MVDKPQQESAEIIGFDLRDELIALLGDPAGWRCGLAEELG